MKFGQSRYLQNQPWILNTSTSDALRIMLIPGTFPAFYQATERDPQIYYEFLIRSKALQMKGMIFPFIDSLPASKLSLWFEMSCFLQQETDDVL